MPTKRAILAELTRAELRINLDHYELTVDDRRVKAQLENALARSRKARIGEILNGLSRNRLKELCRSFGLDDSGRKKADIAERLVGSSAALPPSESRTAVSRRSGGPSPRGVFKPSTQASESPADVLSVAQLEQYLWSAADILRGSIDSSDYKNYIFGLLFLKRLSDRFEEEAEKLIAEGLSETEAWTNPDEHQFFVPDRARWNTIRTRATNIGETLNKACAALEEQNSALEGVLAGIDYNDERKLGDARNRDTVLARLVQHFSQISLRNERMAEPDLLGRAYEYLIEQFADDAGKKGGEFYTPVQVVKRGLMQELLSRGIPGRHSRFKETAIGEMPETWDVVRLGQVFKLASGKSIAVRQLDAARSSESPYAVFGENGIAGFCSSIVSEPPLLIVGRVGEYCGRVHHSDEPCWVSDNALYTREWLRSVNVRFLHNLLQFIDLTKLRKKTGQPLVTQGPIHDLVVPFAPVAEQDEIAEILDRVDSRLSAEERKRESLHGIKRALMHVLLTGELRVTPDTVGA